MNKLRMLTQRRFVIIITGMWPYNNILKGDTGVEKSGWKGVKSNQSMKKTV